MSQNGIHKATRKVAQYVYKPLPDITVYELALLIPVFTGALMNGNITDIINGLPDEASRHFEEME